ncbi:MAG: GldG family protein [Gammaproteobacteria bacterium]|nr:GldG family protein [Gammaproteobacteria bacterium]
MEVTKKTRRHFLLQSSGFLVLFLSVSVLLAWLTTRYSLDFDWTATGRNTLSAASVKVLEHLQGPLTITAYTSGNDESPLRKHIRELIKRYQKHKPDISLEFVDPLTNPDKVRALGIRMDGEMIFSYANRSEHVTAFDEASLTNAMQRLLRVQQRKIVFVTGHGERDPQGRANHDYGGFFQSLANKGIQTKKVNLAQEHAIPADTAALVIAGPQVDYLEGEIKLIQNYLDAGGNLLWLHDPLSKVNLPALSSSLGIEFQSGIIIDRDVELLGIKDPSIIMAAEYPAHPITKGFTFLTLFPRALGINTAANKTTWQYTTILQSVKNSWLERGDLHSGSVRFDPKVDLPGPIVFGVAGSREIKAKPTPDNTKTDNAKTNTAKTDSLKPTAVGSPTTQRVVIVGDGDFISNAFWENQGNQQLGENIINWLAQDDSFIDIPIAAAIDTQIVISQTGFILLGAFFILLVPAGLGLAGIVIWLRRRKR